MRVFLARDPGGANVIATLFRLCPEPKVLWAKDFARAVMRREGLPFRDFNMEIADRPLGPGDGAVAAAWLVGNLGATLMVTATSNIDDFTDRLAWEAAAAAGIPTLAVVDQWVRPLERFQAAGKTWRPDYAVVPSQAVAERLEAAGCVSRRALPLGHPHLQDIAARVPTLAARRGPVREWLADRAGRPFSRVLTYASEPFRYLASRGALFADIPYDELQVLDMVKTALSRSGLADCLLVVKLHPKDDPAAFASLEDLVIKDEIAPYDLIAASDMVVGLKGMLLIESVLFGKAVYSLTLHPSPDEQLVTNTLGLSHAARDVDELAEHFRNFPNFQAFPSGRIGELLGLDKNGLGSFLEAMALAETKRVQ